MLTGHDQELDTIALPVTCAYPLPLARLINVPGLVEDLVLLHPGAADGAGARLRAEAIL